MPGKVFLLKSNNRAKAWIFQRPIKGGKIYDSCKERRNAAT